MVVRVLEEGVHYSRAQWNFWAGGFVSYLGGHGGYVTVCICHNSPEGILYKG